MSQQRIFATPLEYATWRQCLANHSMLPPTAIYGCTLSVFICVYTRIYIYIYIYICIYQMHSNQYQQHAPGNERNKTARMYLPCSCYFLFLILHRLLLGSVNGAVGVHVQFFLSVVLSALLLGGLDAASTLVGLLAGRWTCRLGDGRRCE